MYFTTVQRAQAGVSAGVWGYPSTTRPQGVLTARELAYLQRRDAPRALRQILDLCLDQYLYAQQLLHPSTPLPCRREAYATLDLTPLLPGWDRLCCWYRATLFDAQLDLFTCPYQAEVDRWQRFVIDRCFGTLLARPNLTRSVLVATGVIAADGDAVRCAVTGFEGYLIDIAKESEDHARTCQRG